MVFGLLQAREKPLACDTEGVTEKDLGLEARVADILAAQSRLRVSQHFR